MSQLKYYTPQPEDLFVGYECEKLLLDFSCQGEGCPKEWEHHVIGYDLDLSDLREGRHTILVDPRWYRTSYLTPEQILAEGWDEQGNKGPYHIENVTFLQEGKPRKILIVISRVDKNGHAMYSGLCPSINEFRKICKLLSI